MLRLFVSSQAPHQRACLGAVLTRLHAIGSLTARHCQLSGLRLVVCHASTLFLIVSRLRHSYRSAVVCCPVASSGCCTQGFSNMYTQPGHPQPDGACMQVLLDQLFIHKEVPCLPCCAARIVQLKLFASCSLLLLHAQGLCKTQPGTPWLIAAWPTWHKRKCRQSSNH
jgi:hypothetical protein